MLFDGEWAWQLQTSPATRSRPSLPKSKFNIYNHLDAIDNAQQLRRHFHRYQILLALTFKFNRKYSEFELFLFLGTISKQHTISFVKQPWGRRLCSDWDRNEQWRFILQ